MIDEWMENRRANPAASAAETKPTLAVDRCFTATGEPIAAGPDVWNGILDAGPDGVCTEVFPTYTTSRIEAGGPIRGGVYKCALQSVEVAIASGMYGSWVPAPEQVAQLKAIFPSGVCDYSQPDVGRP